MKTFIYPEMITHVGICSHKNPTNVLLISDTSELIETELDRHMIETTEVISSSNAKESIEAKSDATSDLIIVDGENDPALLAHINRVLKEDGMVVMRHNSLDDIQSNKSLMQILGNYFKIIMPFNVGDGTTLLLASKAYHPTADIILQRADLIDGLQYYNCDIHIASFAMGNFIRKEYLGVIKN
jgi:spermidine synthase